MATVSASCPGALWPLLCIHFSTSLVAMAHANPIRAPPAVRRAQLRHVRRHCGTLYDARLRGQAIAGCSHSKSCL